MTDSKPALAMIPVCLVYFLAAQDFAIINSSLAGIAAQFSVPVTQLQWAVSAQLLTVGALLVPAGSAADRFGRKTMLVSGLLTVALGQLVVFEASSFSAVVIGRIVSGCGVAAVLPVPLMLVAELFPQHLDRDRALTTTLAAQLVGLLCGAQSAGMLIAAFGWRYAFSSNFVIALVTVPLALGLLPRTRGSQESVVAPQDVPGLVLVLGLSAMLVYTVSVLSERGLSEGSTGWLLACVAVAYVLVRVERHARRPILPMNILGKPRFVRATGLIALVTCFNAALIFTLSLHLHRSGAHAGDATLRVFAPMAAGSLLGTWLIPRLVERSSRSAVILGGLAVDTLLLVTVALLLPESLLALPVIMFLVSLSMLAVLGPVQTEVLSDADPESRGVVSSLLRMSANLPTGLGVAAVAGALAAGGERLALFTVAAYGFAGILLYLLTSLQNSNAAAEDLHRA